MPEHLAAVPSRAPTAAGWMRVANLARIEPVHPVAAAGVGVALSPLARVDFQVAGSGLPVSGRLYERLLLAFGHSVRSIQQASGATKGQGR
jgi:hypothetical protein